MKQIAVLSGKGGSGKTFISSSLAVLMANAVFADCDVDAANLHLMLRPRRSRCEPFVSGSTAAVDPERCTACGACAEACRFTAIEMRARAVVDPLACEGCGVCRYVCPVGAISMHEQRRGRWCVSQTEYGALVHARLEPGEENSGKLVEQVRRSALQSARESGADWILIDGPPGTGCAAKSAMTGVDYLVLVAEPTVSGVHDVDRVIRLARHFRIPVGLVVNKSDLSTAQTGRLDAIATAYDLPRLGSIPFSAEVPHALTRLEPYPLGHADAITVELRAIWRAIRTVFG